MKRAIHFANSLNTYRVFFVLLVLFSHTVFSQNQDSVMIRKLYDYYLVKGKAYSNLEELCTTIGARLSGSPEAEKAVQWAKKAMYAAGADTVILQPCMVPHWVRGKKEKCTVFSTRSKLNIPLTCLALGGSEGTG